MPSASAARAGTVEDVPVELAVGTREACARRRSGRVTCWGNGVERRAPDAQRPAWGPRDVVGIDDAQSIAANDRATCVARRGGAVFCWGSHARWRGERTEPFALPGFAGGIRSVSVGFEQIVGVRHDGGVVATAAQPIASSTAVVKVLAGRAHACTLDGPGHIRCFGLDGTERSTWPATGVDVALPFAATDLALARFGGCAIAADQAMACWGIPGRDDSLLGETPWIRRVEAGPFERARALASGFGRCAADVDGRVSCWEHGYVGAGDKLAPVPVEGLDDATALAASGNGACVLRSGVRVACWGANDEGQLGKAPPRRFRAPMPVSRLGGVEQLAMSERHVFALDHDGAVWSWGGAPDPNGRSVARLDVALRREAIEPMRAIRTLGHEACAIARSGRVLCKRVGKEASEGEPWEEITSLRGVRALAGVELAASRDLDRAGKGIWYAVDETGTVRAALTWDASLRTTKPDRARWIAVSGVADVVDVGVAEAHASVVMRSGKVFSWDNDVVYTALENGKASVAPTLVAAPLEDATRADGACVATRHGELRCFTKRPGAALVETKQEPGLAGRVEGVAHRCAWRATGDARCTSSLAGGDGDVVDLVDVRAVAVSSAAVCSVTTAGGVQCFGDNATGQVGQPTVFSSATPIDVELGP